MLDRNRQALPDLAVREERRVRALHTKRHVPADERERLVRAQGPGQEPRFAEDLEAVADAEHEPALSGEVGDRLHRRREARDRAGPEVVAVGEPAGEDDRTDLRQLAVRVPDEHGLGAEALERERGIPIVVRPGEDEDRDARARLAHEPSESSIS